MLIKQLDKSYSIKNKTLGGVATFLCNGKTVKVDLNLVNVDKRKAENWSVVVDFGGAGFVYPFCREKELPFASISQISLILTADGVAAAFADSLGKLNLELAQKFSVNSDTQEKSMNIDSAKNDKRIEGERIFEKKEKLTSKTNENEKSTEYEKFILSSDNYYLTDDETEYDDTRKKSEGVFDANVFSWKTNGVEKKSGMDTKNFARKAVGKYADVFEENAGKTDFYSNVKKEISTIFDSFPVCLDLTEKIRNSVWTKIDGKNGKYFALGLVLAEGMPKYICYALPAKKGMFSEKSEYLEIGRGYRIITQDADTGLVCQKVDFLSLT